MAVGGREVAEVTSREDKPTMLPVEGGMSNLPIKLYSEAGPEWKPVLGRVTYGDVLVGKDGSTYDTINITHTPGDDEEASEPAKIALLGYKDYEVLDLSR